MRVAGIDVSSFAVDVVTIPLDGFGISHRVFLLDGADAFDRTRQVGEVMPGRSSEFWDDILAVAIEEPAGRNPGFAFRVQGAVLSMIPSRMLVTKFMPSEWRKLNGIPGNATKDAVFEWAQAHLGGFGSQDEADAYCIARALRLALEKEEIRAGIA